MERPTQLHGHGKMHWRDYSAGSRARDPLWAASNFLPAAPSWTPGSEAPAVHHRFLKGLASKYLWVATQGEVCQCSSCMLLLHISDTTESHIFWCLHLMLKGICSAQSLIQGPKGGAVQAAGDLRQALHHVLSVPDASCKQEAADKCWTLGPHCLRAGHMAKSQ